MDNSSKGVNNEDLLSQNRAAVLKRLRGQRICSRTDLAKETGLTQAAISKIISSLMECNVVHETGYITGKMGRRSRGVMLNASEFRVIGIKISRRSFSVGLFDVGGTDYDIYKEPIPEDQLPIVSIQKIRAVAEDYLKKSSNILAVGITVPGPYLKKEARIAVMTQTTGWNFIDLRKELGDIGGLPVFIEHDANAAAIAEWWFGEKRKEGSSLVYFLADEGVGAGMVVNGRVLQGDNGIAGEIGHISVDVKGERCRCGNYGCLEGYCSSLAFVKKAKASLAAYPDSSLQIHHQLTADHIFEAAKAGDELAVRLVKYAGEYLGYGIVTLINAYDPSVIIIGNTMARGGKLLMETIQKVVKERVIAEVAEKVSIEFTGLKVDPVLYGACAIATDQVLNHLSSFIGREKTNK